MTYQEVLAALQAQSPYMQGGGSWQDGMWQPSQTALPGVYAMGSGGWVRDPGQGFIEGYSPEADGVRLNQYNPDGSLSGTHFLNSTDNWHDTLRGMVTTLGGAALGANLIGPAVAGATAGGGAAGGGVLAAGVDPALLAEVGGAGSYGATGTTGSIAPWLASGDAAAVGAAGSAGGVGSGGTGAGAGGLLSQVGSPLGSAASSLLSNPGLLAAGLGAVAGVAGNDDMTSSQNTSSTGSASTGLAPWMTGYAQDMLRNVSGLASGPQSNASLDQARQLLTGYATQGDPTVRAGAQQQQSVINGDFLRSNPYINGVASDIAKYMGEGYAVGTRAGMLGAGNANGGYNAGAQQALGMADESFTRGLGSTISNLLYGNYAAERGAQDRAAQGATNFGNFGLNTATTLGQFGTQDWQRPFMANQYFGNAINPAFGSQTNTSQNGTQSTNVNAPSNWLAGAGGALAGYGLYRNIFGGK